MGYQNLKKKIIASTYSIRNRLKYNRSRNGWWYSWGQHCQNNLTRYNLSPLCHHSNLSPLPWTLRHLVMVSPKPGGAREFKGVYIFNVCKICPCVINFYRGPWFDCKNFWIANFELHKYVAFLSWPSRLWIDKWQPANARYVEEGWKWVRYDDVMMT